MNEAKIRSTFDRAYQLSIQGRATEALALYDEITRAEPSVLEAWYNKAVAYERLGSLDSAIECYYRAIQLKPNHEGATRGLAVLLFSRCRYNRARYWIEKAIRNGDNHPDLPSMAVRCSKAGPGSPLIFVSYSWDNIDQVEKCILPALEDARFEYFIDRNRIPQGDDLGELRWQIEQGLAQCDTFLLLWTEPASTSAYVASELCTALAMCKKIVLVVMDETDPPSWLERQIENGSVTPVSMWDSALLVEESYVRDDMLSQVRRCNRKAQVLPEAACDIELDLVGLKGGALIDFAIGKYPITQDQWAAVMGSNPAFYQGDGKRPVESISWYEADDFLSALSESAGLEYRLPNEAEWEFACRAGCLGNWCHGDDEGRLQEFAWYIDNTSIGKPGEESLGMFAVDGVSYGFVEASPYPTNSVFTKRPNDWGIFHMHGNVSEWCADVTEEDSESRRVRGGSYRNAPRNLRCAARGSLSAASRENDVGFRVCRSLSGAN